MKRTTKKNLDAIFSVLLKLEKSANSDGDIRRKEIVAECAKKGLETSDTFPIFKPHACGAQRGFYNVEKLMMIVSGLTKKVASKNEKNLIEEVDESGLFEVEAARNEAKSYNNLAWGAFEYTEDDINDELSLMGTYL